ncbi:Zn-ribbon domain-containing OB-fold protein [Pseudonocardia endophytica]|nr:OB-fold domain-containing protein [Pseudonocardia endophytica]
MATAPFFDGAAREQLMIRRCERCAHPEPPEARTCSSCASVDLTWISATGRGHLVTWTVVHRAPHPDLAGAVPYVAGIVELDEGPWLHARICGDPTTMRAGLPVRVAFVHPDLGESVPLFTPSD